MGTCSNVSTRSEFLGHDSFGNPQFDTKRTELGELVFRLKNRNDKNAVDSISDPAVEFIKGWGPRIDLIVPVPPSRKRAHQPVIEIANLPYAVLDVVTEGRYCKNSITWAIPCYEQIAKREGVKPETVSQ